MFPIVVGIQDWYRGNSVEVSDIREVDGDIKDNVKRVGKEILQRVPIDLQKVECRSTCSPLKLLWLASLFFGVRGQRTDQYPARVELSSLNGTNGFVLNAVTAGDSTGISVSYAGDFNGDGTDDMIVGASMATPPPHLLVGFMLVEGMSFTVIGE